PSHSLCLATPLLSPLSLHDALPIFRYLPRVRFSQFPTPLPGGLLFELDTSYARLNTTNILNNTSVQRLDFFPRLTAPVVVPPWLDRKSTRLNSSHQIISYAVFCLNE